MSFFGQQNNQQQQQQQQQQQSSGFGGFGSNNNTTASTGFGQQPQNSGSSLFGNNSNNSGSGFGGFGSGGSGGSTGFGSAASNPTPFSQNRSAFGAATSSGGGLFGSGTTTANNSSGFGGFGNSNTNTSNSGGGLFGSANKPAFGATNNGSAGLFGSSNTTSGTGFGQNSQPASAFGSGTGTGTALGQNVGECQGTGSTPFSAFTEKEGTGNQTNHFQSISFMQPYKNFSFEELRLADYKQGRQFGNGSGQAGAFGSTNFGGGFGQQNNSSSFGQTNNAGGMFGQASSSSPFGANQTAQSGFGSAVGSAVGGSLFGSQAKPAGGLFGQPATSAQPSGGLFGTAATNTGGFNPTNTGGGFSTSGGLFSSNNNNNNNNQNQQSKPFSFGSTTATAGGTGFGSSNPGFAATSNNNTGGLFGQQNQNNNNTNPFGQNQPSQPSGGLFGSAFGGNTNTNQNQSQNTTGNAFGFGQQNQEQKPAGLFGSSTSTNTGGGMFGNTNQNNQQQNSGGLFGNQSNQNPGSSLFGNKPASTGTGLFGNAANSTANNSGGGLFGNAFGTNNQSQQNQGGGLFGNTNNQQKPGGLFSSQTGNTGGLFGNNTNNQSSTGGGLFGSNAQQPQQQTNSLFGNTNNSQGSSLFGNPQQQQPPQPQNAFSTPQAYSTSLLDPNAFGSPSIFGGLPPPPQVTGPIATPISSKKSTKKGALIPHYKFNPSNSSRFQTPQRRGGFGFSYSSYGTPGSISSNASTPGGFNSSTVYNSIGRGLGKSLSTSNLRRNFDEAESVLTPGAFSAGSSRYGGSSNLKRLTIDRSLRTDLFSGGKDTQPALPSPEKERQQGILKKKVSFDASAVGGNGEQLQNNQINGAAGNDMNGPTPEEQGLIRSPRTPARPKQNGSFTQADVEPVRGNELAIVHEDATPEGNATTTNGMNTSKPPPSHTDQQPGNYWMKPSKQELSKLSKDERTRISGFAVGREGCGRVEFERPVDLTLTKTLDEIFGDVVLVELRSITVYPDQAKKPAQGKGLNVPSTLYLENSWPRQKDRKTPLHEKGGPRFNKHVERLKKVGGTEFIRYEKDTGIWVFKVPHFTTYGFDYEDDASMASEMELMQSSILSAPLDTPTPKSRLMRNGQAQPNPSPIQPATSNVASINSSSNSHGEISAVSSPDDTFHFRKKKYLPGTFDEAALPDDEEDEGEDEEMTEVKQPSESFLDERLAASPSESGQDEPSDIQDAVSHIQNRSVVIRNEDDDDDDDVEMGMAGAFPLIDLDAHSTLWDGPGTPGKNAFKIGGDWAETLQRTVSPKKQDRAALREQQSLFLEDQISTRKMQPAKKPNSESIKTHGDLMNSLFGKEESRKSGKQVMAKDQGQQLKWPYARKSKDDDDYDSMPEQVRLLHGNYKPRWSSQNTLMYSTPLQPRVAKKSPTQDSVVSDRHDVLVSNGKIFVSVKVGAVSKHIPQSLSHQRKHTKVSLYKGIPMAHPLKTPFADVARSVQPESSYQKQVWALASILFDDLNPSSLNVPASEFPKYESRLRKDHLIAFWSKLSLPSVSGAIDTGLTHEERAVSHLSYHNVPSACAELVAAKDYRLSTLVAQLGDGDKVVRDDMVAQIDTWRDLNVLSEMAEPIRALYALLAGQTCICEGKKGPVEDRARDFVISERFKLDWKRAFGLRLYYATLTSEPIEVAIKAFAEDIRNGRETAKPTRKVLAPDGSEQTVDGDDLLWSLLQLYAASKDWLPFASIAQILNQQDITSGNKLNVMLSFQLYHALTARFPNLSHPAAGDALAAEFASQLDAVDEWLWATFATLHISSSAQRQQAVQDLLAHHATEFNADPSDSSFVSLTQELKIPEVWIWQAKALAARASLSASSHSSQANDARVHEVTCLINAADWVEAHSVLRRSVAPRCVISENWTLLHSLLENFRQGKENIPDWSSGGQVYEDFLSIVAPASLLAQLQSSPDPSASAATKRREEVLTRLLDSLPGLVDDRDAEKKRLGSREALEEVVALKEMSRVVGKEVLALAASGSASRAAKTGGGGVGGADLEESQGRVLNLPSTREVKLGNARILGERMFRGVMAGSS